MALLECHCFSETLGMSITFDALIPQATTKQIGMEGRGGRDHPVLFLLHGRSDDHSTWLRRTSIERYVAPLNLAVIMPNAHLSRYTDMAYGGKYFTFLTDELPRLARSFFHLSDQREDTFIAGLSMGGYGTMKAALRRPEVYAAAASLSGSLDVAGRLDKWDEEFRQQARAVFGPDLEAVRDSDDDLLHLLQTADKGALPRLFQCCGTEDFLYADNQRFRETARAAGIDITYEEGPGVHDWAFWDCWIQRVLDWLPLRSEHRS